VLSRAPVSPEFRELPSLLLSLGPCTTSAMCCMPTQCSFVAHVRHGALARSLLCRAQDMQTIHGCAQCQKHAVVR